MNQTLNEETTLVGTPVYRYQFCTWYSTQPKTAMAPSHTIFVIISEQQNKTMGGNKRLVSGDYRRVDARTEEERVEGRRETAEISPSGALWSSG